MRADGFMIAAVALLWWASAVYALDGVITRVLDGDTADLLADDGQTYRVRFIGLNTPERTSPMPCVKRWAYQARDVASSFLLGQRVRAEQDVELYDRYGRMLAYIFLPQEPDVADLHVNALLLQMGLGWVGESGHNVRYKSVYLMLQGEAKAALRGLWGD